jgi:hypothetical protein
MANKIMSDSKVFISDSRKNPEWKNQLPAQLVLLVRHHLLDVRHDGKNGGGEDWHIASIKRWRRRAFAFHAISKGPTCLSERNP